LAKACEVFDVQQVNRLLLDNTGINGDQLASILQGMAQLSDFKSLIYRQNSINLNSLAALQPIFVKRLPH